MTRTDTSIIVQNVPHSSLNRKIKAEASQVYDERNSRYYICSASDTGVYRGSPVRNLDHNCRNLRSAASLGFLTNPRQTGGSGIAKREDEIKVTFSLSISRTDRLFLNLPPGQINHKQSLRLQ